MNFRAAEKAPSKSVAAKVKTLENSLFDYYIKRVPSMIGNTKFDPLISETDPKDFIKIKNDKSEVLKILSSMQSNEIVRPLLSAIYSISSFLPAKDFEMWLGTSTDVTATNQLISLSSDNDKKTLWLTAIYVLTKEYIIKLDISLKSLYYVNNSKNNMPTKQQCKPEKIRVTPEVVSLAHGLVFSSKTVNQTEATFNPFKDNNLAPVFFKPDFLDDISCKLQKVSEKKDQLKNLYKQYGLMCTDEKDDPFITLKDWCTDLSQQLEAQAACNLDLSGTSSHTIHLQRAKFDSGKCLIVATRTSGTGYPPGTGIFLQANGAGTQVRLEISDTIDDLPDGIIKQEESPNNEEFLKNLSKIKKRAVVSSEPEMPPEETPKALTTIKPEKWSGALLSEVEIWKKRFGKFSYYCCKRQTKPEKK